jgi:hypothetical protein
LEEDETARRYAFVREYGALLKDTSGLLNVTWISDEAHFHSDGYISTETLAKAVNDFVLRLHKVHDHWGHRMQQRDFPSA